MSLISVMLRFVGYDPVCHGQSIRELLQLVRISLMSVLILLCSVVPDSVCHGRSIKVIAPAGRDIAHVGSGSVALRGS